MPGEKDLHPYQKFCVDFLEEKPQCALFLDVNAKMDLSHFG